MQRMLGCGAEGVVQRLLCVFKIAEQENQRCQYSPRFVAIDAV
jgi:hypothetical protein